MKRLFGQAVCGTSPKALKSIQNDEIDLATWENSLSEQAATYFSSCDLEELFNNADSAGNYFRYVARQKFCVNDNENLVSDTRESARELLTYFPEHSGKKEAVIDLAKMARNLFSVTGETSTNVVLIVFKPRENGVRMHKHPEDRFIGNVTLAGKKGMIWRPTVCPSQDNNKPKIQKINLGAFSVFKGAKLNHGTPTEKMTDKLRLGAVMFTPYRNDF